MLYIRRVVRETIMCDIYVCGEGDHHVLYTLCGESDHHVLYTSCGQSDHHV